MTVPHIPRGPVMADIAAFRLTEEEKQRLLDPAIGGIILFRRNFQNIEQLKTLTAEIKALRTPELIIASITKAAGCNGLSKVLPACPQ